MGTELSTAVARPASQADLARTLADAQRQGLKVEPRGGGTKADWGSPPERVDLVLSTLNVNRVLEHAAGDMTVTVEAGCTVAEVQRQVATAGQRLALDPLWPDRATVGGVIATNDSGSLRAGFGSLRDLILGVTVALPDGTLASSGGKVVKNVAGYDLPKLMVGAYGTLGVVTRATFRLHPLPEATRIVLWQAAESEPVWQFVMSVLGGAAPVAGLDVVAERDQPVTAVALLEGSPRWLDVAEARLGEAASSSALTRVPAPPPGAARERLWGDGDSAAVCKVTLLPKDFLELLWVLNHKVPAGQAWALCLSAAGVGWLRLGAPRASDVAATVQLIRRHLHLLEGSLVVTRSADEVKRQAGAWRHNTSALPLMMRIKQNFDPANTLNAGRFVGGI